MKTSEKRDMITLMLPCKDIFNFQMFFTHHKAGKYEQIKCKSCILFCKVDTKTTEYIHQKKQTVSIFLVILIFSYVTFLGGDQ